MLVVVNYPFAIELVFFPISLIGYAAVRVVKNSHPVHLVVPPLPVIVAALLVVKLPSAVPHAVEFPPFVACAYAILLNDKLYFVLRVGRFRLLHWLIDGNRLSYFFFDCLSQLVL